MVRWAVAVVFAAQVALFVYGQWRFGLFPHLEGVRAHRGYPLGWTYVLGLYAGGRGPFMAFVTVMTATMMGVMRAKARLTGEKSDAA